MKKFYRKMIVSFVITLLVLVGVMTVSFFYIRYSMASSKIKQMLVQAEQGYYQNRQDNEENALLHEKDFFTRAMGIDFLLRRDPSLISDEGLQEVRSRMDVDEIHLFDEKGFVLATTDEERRNGEAEEESRLRQYLLDPKSPEREAYWQKDSGGESQNCSVVLRSESEDYASIMVEMGEGIHHVLTEDALMRQTLSELVTEYSTAIVAFSAKTGELKGITQNNPQEIRVLNAKGKETDSVKRIRELEGRVGYLRLNTGDAVASAMSVGDYVLLGFVSTSNILLDLCLQTFVFLLVALVFGGLGLDRLRRYWKFYLINDLDRLEISIAQVLAGDFHGETSCVHNEELRSLAEAFDALKAGYVYRGKRLSRIAGSLGDGIAIFDCVKKSGMTFFSGNMQEILGMKRVEWEAIRNNYESFERLMEGLTTHRDAEGISHIGGRHLDIRMTQDETGMSGVIIDASEEVVRRNKLISRLSQAESVALHDTMTGLYNRFGFEKGVVEYLDRPNPVGVLLMMDMDNFKRVNDTMGHPEGDYLLALVGKSLKRAFREEDVIAHLSGDEFAVFLPSEFTREELEEKLEALLVQLRKDFGEYARKCGVSMSIGAVFARQEIYAELYKQADSALYIAKQMGKNCFYINEERITCMRVECVFCREKCPRREALKLTPILEEPSPQ